MQFAPVAAGIPAAHALALRGHDPVVIFAANTAFDVVLGKTLNATPGPGPNQRSTHYSTVAGLLGGLFHTRDLAVLALDIVASVPPLAALHGLFTQLVADGLDANAELSREEFWAAAEEVLAGLDHAVLHANYLLTGGAMFAVQPPGGALGGNATLWARAGQFGALAEPDPLAPGLYRLPALGWLYWLAPGVFHSAERDVTGKPFRSLMELCRLRAQSAQLAYASAGPPLSMAAAALSWFKSMRPPAGWSVNVDSSTTADPALRHHEASIYLNMSNVRTDSAHGESCAWMVGFIILELGKLAADHPRLQFAVERVLTVEAEPETA